MKELDDHDVFASGLRRSTSDRGLCPTNRDAFNSEVINRLTIFAYVVAN
jgi:hypothetical protein